MQTQTAIMKSLMLNEDCHEIPKYGSFRNQILNDIEMYQEDLMMDDDDIFGGTEDSYANEMVEQHLFDTIYYNIKCHYDSQDAAMNTAQDVMFYLLDFVKRGEVSFQNDGVIKEIYDKYVANNMNESVEEEEETIFDLAKKNSHGAQLYNLAYLNLDDRLESIGYMFRFKNKGMLYFQRNHEHFNDEVIVIEGDYTFAEKFDPLGESLVWNEDELRALLNR